MPADNDINLSQYTDGQIEPTPEGVRGICMSCICHRGDVAGRFKMSFRGCDAHCKTCFARHMYSANYSLAGLRQSSKVFDFTFEMNLMYGHVC